MPSSVLYIIDPFLKTLGGHYYTMDRGYVEGAKRLGHRSLILADRRIDAKIAAELPVERVFNEQQHLWFPNERFLRIPRFGKLLDKLSINLVFFWHLLQKLNRRTITRDDVVFIPTTTPRLLYGCAWWYRMIPAEKRPRLILLVHLPSYPYFESRGTYSALRMLATTPGGRVTLGAHSERLAREHARFSRLPVSVLPIPISEITPAEPLLLDGIDLAQRCFVYLGDARDEKGIIEIIQAIRQLKRTGDLEQMSFILQVTRASDKPAEACYALIDELEAEQLPNVILIKRRLEPGEYQALLARADVVLLPYWQSEYVSRISSVFAEALAAAKPVIATADTWMSEQLEHYGAGVIFRDKDPLDLKRAMLAMAAQYPTYAAKAIETQSAWRALHNPANLIAALFDPKPLTSRPARIAVIYPFWGLMDAKSGNARRTRQMIEYLRGRFDHVRVLSVGEEPDYVDRNVQFLFFRQRRFGHWLTYRFWERLYRRYQTLITLGENKKEISPLWPLWEYYRFPVDPALKRPLRQLTRWADTIILEYPFWARVLAEDCKRENVRLIITAHDLLADILTQSFTLHEIALKLELAAYHMADEVVTVSAGDQQKLQKFGVNSTVAEHGMDWSDYEALPPDKTMARTLLADAFNIVLPAQNLCLFVGSWNYPNLDAVTIIREIAQPLRAPFVGEPVYFVLAGGAAEPERTDNFIALGNIEEEALNLLYKAVDLVLIPLQMGTGASVKTAEAMSYGKPILGTRIGFRGYLVTSGVEAIVSDNLSDYPALIRTLLGNPIALQEIGHNARRFARRYHYTKVYRAYERLVMEQQVSIMPEITMQELMAMSMGKMIPYQVRQRLLRRQRIQFFLEKLRESRSHVSAQKLPERTVHPATLDYRPRWGYSQPGHAQLSGLFEKFRHTYTDLYKDIAALMPFLYAISPDFSGDQPSEPYWQNYWITAFDAALIYTFMVKYKPRIFLEAGSGMTTLFAARAKRDHNLSTRIISIDPKPRREVDRVCDEVIRQGMETIDLALFEQLSAGDIVLIDSSHRVFMNSDVTVFMLDVLPRLQPGVNVHFHDIHLPFDYPPEWANRYYSEQYILGAWLLAASNVQILMPSRYMSNSQEANRILRPLIKHWPYAIDEWLSGTSLWLTKVPPR